MCHGHDLPGSIAPCVRGRDELRPTLFRYADPAKPGVLGIPLGDGRVVECYVPKRYETILLLLLEAWHEDAEAGDVPTMLIGFLTAADLAELVAGMPGYERVIEKEAVVSYVKDLRKIVNSALDEAYGPDASKRLGFAIIETQRGLGYRIGGSGLIVQCVCRRRG